MTSLGMGAVYYEPDGNIPPDFTVDGRIAVEVRRLNQHSKAGGEVEREGLEQLDISLRQRIRKYISTYSRSVNGESWYVGYKFKRPLEAWDVLRPKLDVVLREFIAAPDRKAKKLRIAKNFEIDFMKAGADHGSFFVLGANMDEDSGGWVMLELERNLRICIAEKEEKVAPYRQRYPEWWLVLEDRIDYGVAIEDRARVKTEVLSRIEHTFQRIVLLDPTGRKAAFEA